MTIEQLNEKLKAVGQVTVMNTQTISALTQTICLLAERTLPLADGDAAKVVIAEINELQVRLNGIQVHIEAAMKAVQSDP
jgi:hypothetical protein